MMNSWFEIKCNAESITFVDDCDAVISEHNSKDICTSNLYIYSLPETLNLPSVFMFAECIFLGTRQTRSLPSAALKTLGKKKHSVKRRFAECQKKHSTKIWFAKCPKKTLRNKIIFFEKEEE